MLLFIIQYYRKRITQHFIILHNIKRLRSKMGRPKLGKNKSKANKEYIKKYRNKNAEKDMQEDRRSKRLARQNLKCLKCAVWL